MKNRKRSSFNNHAEANLVEKAVSTFSVGYQAKVLLPVCGGEVRET